MDYHKSHKTFNIQTVPERIAVRGDTWEGFFESAVDLEKLEEQVDADI